MRSFIPLICASCSILTSAAVDPWPAQTTSQAAAGSHQLPASLDTRMQLEMSGAHWNPLTRTLWVTAGGGSGYGTWALAYSDADGGSFSIAEFWSGPRDEDITQASFAPMETGKHRIYILKEKAGQIVQALMTVNPVGNGTSLIERTWSISEIAPNGSSGAEGLAFIPDAWLSANGFVDGGGSRYVSRGGMGGLMVVAHQDGGRLYAIDLSADGSTMFSGKNYHVVGIYKTGFHESSALCFDRSIGRLYVSHNCDGNRVEVTDLTSAAISGDTKATRQVRQLAVVASPALCNPEGFACTPYLTDDGSINPQRWAFFASDCEIGSSLVDKQRAVVWYRQFMPATGCGPCLSPWAGQGQSTLAGTAVAMAPTVRLLDSRGYPLAGVPVSFTPGAGTVGRSSALTDSQGHADCGSWVLGAQAGRQTLTASATGATGITFTATALLAISSDDRKDRTTASAYVMAPAIP